MDNTKYPNLPLFKRLAIILGLSLTLSISAFGQEKGDFLVRMGVVNFDPSVNSSPVTTGTSGNIVGSGVGIDANSQFGLSLSYMLTNALAIEGTFTAPFEHDLAISGLDSYGLNTSNLGEAKQISPTISALYYFGSPSNRFRPYLGAGLSYTQFFDDSLSTQARSELGAVGLELDEHIGMSARAGFDWRMGNGWFLNTSVWRMNIDTNASFDSQFGRISTYLEMDPWVYSITIGHEFSW